MRYIITFVQEHVNEIEAPDIKTAEMLARAAQVRLAMISPIRLLSIHEKTPGPVTLYTPPRVA